MTLSWKQLVCHGLLNQIEEPEVVKYILKIAIKERCAYLSEESREFYSKHMKYVLYCRAKDNIDIHLLNIVLAILFLGIWVGELIAFRYIFINSY